MDKKFLTHNYVSTACTHQLHLKCRRECKWCASKCNCACHMDDETPKLNLEKLPMGFVVKKEDLEDNQTDLVDVMTEEIRQSIRRSHNA